MSDSSIVFGALFVLFVAPAVLVVGAALALGVI